MRQRVRGIQRGTKRETEYREGTEKKIEKGSMHKLLLCMYNSAQHSYHLAFGFSIWVWCVQHSQPLHLKNERGERNREKVKCKVTRAEQKREDDGGRNVITGNRYIRRADIEFFFLM